MPQQALNLANLKNLDFGMINAAFETQIAQAANDCYLRPEDKTARKVHMTFLLKPVQVGGQLDRIETAVDFATQLPVMKTRIYSMHPRVDKGKATGLLFHPDLPDDPEGRSIMDEAEKHQPGDRP